jgi:multidrug efflux pump
MSHFFIDRPIFAAVVSIIITLSGTLALIQLPVAQYPEISPPAVSVAISYPGASAQVVADTVAAPIEQQVNGIEGMLYMSSQSGNDGTYSLTVTFEIGTDLNTALVVVQNRVMLAMPQLPTAVQLQGITVRKRTPDILLVISFYSPDGRYDNIYLSNFATIGVRDELLRVEGVSDINVFGQRDYSMRLWLDPEKLASRNITAQDVAAAVRSQNVEAAPGRAGQPPLRGYLATQLPFDTLGRLTFPEQFGDIIIKAKTGQRAPALIPPTSTGTSGAASASPSMGGGGALTGGAATNVGAAAGSPTAMLPVLLSPISISASATGPSFSTTGSLLPYPAPMPTPVSDTAASGSTPSVASGPATTLPGTNPGIPSPTAGAAAPSPGTSLGIVATDAASAGAAAPASGLIATGGSVGANALTGGTLDGGSEPSSALVRVRDVARVELGAQQYNNGSTYDGMPTVGLAIHLLPGANALDVADRIRAKMSELSPRFPEGLEYAIPYDTTPYIRESVDDVVKTLFQAVGLVAFVVFLFLQNWRAAVIPLIAVPVAILGTFGVMAALQFSINNISLFGLVLAIGIVVDDAIVVVENVERWLEKGLSPRDAAHKAMDEVTGPIVAIALVLLAVFIPCAFVGGITGQFFRQFAVTITASMAFSTINSLTLSPALAAILLKPTSASPGGKGPFGRVLSFLLAPLKFLGRLFTRSFEAGTHFYVRIVGWLLRISLIVFLLYGVLLGLTYWVFSIAPTGFVPDQDQGRLIVSLQLPDSASLERTREALAQVDAIALQDPAVEHTATAAGMSLIMSSNSSNFATAFLILKPFEQRRDPNLSANAAMARLRRQCAEKVPDADVKVFGAPPVPGLSVASGYKVMIQDRGGLGLAALQKQTDAVVAKLQKEHTVVGTMTQFRSKTPQLYLDVDRTKVQSLGINLNDVNETMQIYLGSLYVTSFNEFGRHWQVTLQAEGSYRARMDGVALLQVRNQWGEMAPLGTLMHLRPINGPVAVTRYNLYTSAAVTGIVRPGVSSSEAIAAVDRVANETLPRSMSTDWTELMFLQIRAGNTSIYMFFLAVAFVFLALAALYESWALPLAVILVVPLCMLFSMGGVLLSGRAVDIFVQIGLVVLVGLACKNAILIVEFAEVLHREGKPRDQAAVEASRLRIRPILMTSLAFILGVLPLVFASGAGAEMRQSLGVAVFAGMLGVTAFGIFLTPVFYDLIQRFVDWRLKSGRTVFQPTQ